MGLRKDIWRTGILEAPLATLIETSDWSRIPCHFLPDMPRAFQFRADPFGMWHDDKLHIFLEIYDYRDRIGAIEVFVYDRAYTLLRNEVVLREPWHLSYPQVIEAEGSYWMLPEAHRSGTQTLYRAERFPDRWVPEATIDLGGEIAVDATLHFQEGLWWLIYTPVEAAKKAPSRLHVAYARTLHGPWTRHHQNPVRIDPSSARAGGTPVKIDGRLMLPVQDCARTYGGGRSGRSGSMSSRQSVSRPARARLCPLPRPMPPTMRACTHFLPWERSHCSISSALNSRLMAW